MQAVKSCWGGRRIPGVTPTNSLARGSVSLQEGSCKPKQFSSASVHPLGLGLPSFFSPCLSLIQLEVKGQTLISEPGVSLEHCSL